MGCAETNIIGTWSHNALKDNDIAASRISATPVAREALRKWPAKGWSRQSPMGTFVVSLSSTQWSELIRCVWARADGLEVACAD